jgi:uroporphyrinogen decarboxylase
MLSRRAFLITSTAATLVRGAATLTPKERVDRALKGQDADRSPFTFWHHFLDETKPGEQHAKSTLDFHKKFHTDLVKVMSDYPYPKGKAQSFFNTHGAPQPLTKPLPPVDQWFDLKPDPNPFPQQIRALELIRDGLNGEAYFLETLFNPYKVAEKLSSEDAVLKLRQEQPQRLLDMLEVIAKSQASHAKRAIGAGASGIFLAIANSLDHEYQKFSAPFDKMILAAVSTAPLNVLHIHGDKIDPAHFYHGWAATGVNYSAHATKIPLADFRKHYTGVLLAGLDEVNYRNLSAADLKQQHQDAMLGAGKKFILSPGCSVPNDSTDAEMLRLTQYLQA